VLSAVTRQALSERLQRPLQDCVLAEDVSASGDIKASANINEAAK